MTPTPSPSKAASVSQRIAELIDENAEVYSENAMDRAFLGNSEELANLIVKCLTLSASPEAPSLSAAVPASGAEAVARERAEIARLVDDLALNARLERAGEKATSVGSTGAICMSIGAESMAKAIARSIRERASLSPAPPSGSEAGGEAVEGKLVKRPVAFRICAPDLTSFATLYYKTEDAAREASEQIGVEYEALYVRDGTPLNFPALAKPASEPADGAVRERAVGLFENFVRSTACGHVVRGLISEERAAVWTQEIVDDFRASLAALSAPASSSPAGACEYCGDGKYTGLPGNACENCLNTGLKYPEARK